MASGCACARERAGQSSPRAAERDASASPRSPGGPYVRPHPRAQSAGRAWTSDMRVRDRGSHRQLAGASTCASWDSTRGGMLPPRMRIHRAGDFRDVTRTRPVLRSARMVVYARASTGSSSRLGVIVARTIGGSVVRSRVSRRLRHAAARVLPTGGTPTEPAVDLVARALPGIVTADWADLVKDLAAAVRVAQHPAR